MARSETSLELEAMCREHFNEPMLSCEEVARCIGYGEDESDCYIITRRRDGSIIWNTCVGGYIWLRCLKGQGYVRSTSGEDWDDYFRLDNVLQINRCPREPEFILKLRPLLRRSSGTSVAQQADIDEK